MDFPPLSQMKDKFAAGFDQTVRESLGGNSSTRAGVFAQSAEGLASSSVKGTNTNSSVGSRSFVNVITGKKTNLDGGDWNQLLGANNLAYHKPLVKDGKRLVHLPSAVSENASKI